MPEFAYTARNASGRDITGLVSAETKRDVLAMLTERALFPIKVEESKAKGAGWAFKRPIKAEVLAATLTQLSDLLQNGVPLMRSLEVLAEQATHPRLGEVLDKIRGRIAEGEPLNEAMAAHPDVFNELTVNIVRAGTEGAFLEESLRQTAEFLERQEELRSRVRGAMAYPAFLATAGSIVTIVLIVFFVPKFAEIFAQQEEQGALPGPTVALLFLSNLLGTYGILILGAFIGLVILIRKWAVTPQGRQSIDQWKIKLPLFGPIFLNSAVSRFCRILGTLLRNGVPLIKALDISSESSGNVVLGQAIRNSAENVSSGESLSGPLASCGLLPSNVMAMIAVAEESNNLENVLNNVAETIDRKISRQLDTMVRLIEPALLMVMGSAVLFVISALLLPVFEMSTNMG